jgi:hypothetical protein
MSWSYECSILIGRPPAEVFAFCSDLRRELEWNPDARSIEKLTAGPIGPGTRYRARWARTAATLVEVARYEPPHRWETASQSLGMSIRVTGTVEADPAGARYTVRLALQPRGFARVIAPVALRAMRRREPRNMERIRRVLEATGHATGSSPPVAR